MKKISLNNISQSKANNEMILNNLSLSIPPGKFFALLGPSGCGKTTLLRLIAGFETPDSGTIYLGNSNITQSPVNERAINIVFQNYALFPHLNVYDNIAYSLTIQKLPQSLIEERVLKLLKTFHLDKHIFKKPSQLSGGQQQRVAIARAIINEPEVLLLDEPLAALDFHLREQMLLELIELQTRLKTTFIYVTHDQLEALTVADHMAIMNQNGEVEQVDTPENIYEYPASKFVAQFVGTSNILQGTFCNKNSIPHIEIPHLGTFPIHTNDTPRTLYNGENIFLSIRPEKIQISKYPSKSYTLKGTVCQILYHGRSTQYNIRVNQSHIIQVFEQNERYQPKEEIDYNNTVYFGWDTENTRLLVH